MNEKEQMKLDMVKNLALLLMADDQSIQMADALGIVFNSDTYQCIQNEKTHFYFQSPRYVYSFLVNELKEGKVG